MKTEILSSLEHLPYFTIQAVKQYFPYEEYQKGTVQTAVYRWVKSGKIIRLKKGVYTTRKFSDLHRNDFDFPIMVSSIIVPQSYVSTHFILQQNSILTEATYLISAVTVKHGQSIDNDIGSYVYQHIKKKLFTGYILSDYYGVTIARATKAKALFDYFYLRPISGNTLIKKNSIVEELRLNIDEFSTKEKEEFEGYINSEGGPKMNAILRNIQEHVWRA